MSLSGTTNSVTYTLSGSAQTVTIPFAFQQAADIRVSVGGVDISSSSYTVTGGGYNSANVMQTGSVTINGYSGSTVTVYRSTVLQQNTSFASTGYVTPLHIEQVGDKSIAASQDIYNGFTSQIATLTSEVNSAIASSNNPTVQTIAALKALNVSSLITGAAINLLGYYVAGDGGGGTFYYSSTSSATDNGGTIIAPTSGSGRWLRVYSGKLNVRWFGAKGDGATNDLSAFQAAVNIGGWIDLPAGNFFVNGEIAVSKFIALCGIGWSSVITQTNTTSNTFKITTTDSNLLFRDLTITASTSKTTGDAIVFDSTSGNVTQFPAVENCRIAYHNVGVNFVRSAGFRVNGGYIVSNVIGVQVANTDNPDNGDSFIGDGVTFDSSRSESVACVKQLSGGGLKLSGFKMLAHQYGYLMNLTTSGSTSDLIISDGSIEGQSVSGAHFTRTSTSYGFANVQIDNVQVGVSCPSGIDAVTSGGAYWLQTFSVTDCIIGVSPSSGTANCISLDGVDEVEIGGNTMVSRSGTVTGIKLNTVGHYFSQPNNFRGLSVNESIGVNLAFYSVTAAATIAIPTDFYGTIVVSGTTAVTTITGGYIGRKISMIMVNGAAFVFGGNIANNFTNTSGQVRNLIFDGSYWYVN